MSDKTEPDNKPQHGQRDSRGRFVSARQKADAPKVATPTDQDAKHNKRDWWDKANILVTAGATFVIAAATVATVWVTLHHAEIFSEQLAEFRTQASAASEQTKALKRQLTLLEADQRPWISAKLEITADFVANKKGANIGFRYTFKNVGKSPALNVFGYARIKPNTQDLLTGGAFHADPQGQLTSHCTELSKLTTDVTGRPGQFFGDVIFPGDSVVVDDEATINRDEEVTAPPGTIMIERQRKFTAPILITFCVAYQASLETNPRQTGQAYYLTRKRSDVPGGILYVDPSELGTIPASELGLRAPTISGNQYAN
jgi:hypothetical protein